MNKIASKGGTQQWIYILIVSVFAGTFAFLLLRLLSELTVLYFSYDLNISAIPHLKDVQFLTKSTSPDWTRDSIITIYLSKPIMNFSVGMAGMMLYALIKRKSQSFSFFLVWLIIFALNNAFGTFAENMIFRTGIYEVTNMMNFGGVMMTVVVTLSFYFLYISGVGAGKLIMLSLPQDQIKKGRIQFTYFLVAYFIPWLLTFLIIFTKSDKNSLITYGFAFIILLATLWSRDLSSEEMHQEPLPPFMWIDFISLIFYAIGIFLMYTMLTSGIKLI
jgi:hypothetical protein